MHVCVFRVFGMEAVALYTFRATEGDELSFNKGDVLKVRSRPNTLPSFTSGNSCNLKQSAHAVDCS